MATSDGSGRGPGPSATYPSGARYELLVDSVGFKGRPKPHGDSEIGAIRNRLARPDSLVSLDALGLADIILQGRTIMPGVCLGGTSKEHWVRQQVFALDFDNDGVTRKIGPGEALDRAFRMGLDPILAYPTASSTMRPWNPRFRILFGLDEPVTERDEAEEVGRLLLEVFPEADRTSTRLTQMFFSPGREVWGPWT